MPSDPVARLYGGPALYVASRSRHAPMWRSYRAAGWPIISTWINEPVEGQATNDMVLWQRIIMEIGEATALIFYTEAGDDPWKRASAEAGAALMAGIPIYAALRGIVTETGKQGPAGSWLAHPLAVRCWDVPGALRIACGNDTRPFAACPPK